MDAARQKQEIDRNYDAFVRILSDILPAHRDQLALMRDGEIVGYFNTPRQALVAAAEQFPDGVFSIEEVTDEPSPSLRNLTGSPHIQRGGPKRLPNP